MLCLIFYYWVIFFICFKKSTLYLKKETGGENEKTFFSWMYCGYMLFSCWRYAERKLVEFGGKNAGSLGTAVSLGGRSAVLL
jgi:hypothetical protein